MFIFFGILPRIHKSHAAEPNGSADPRLGTPAIHSFVSSTLYCELLQRRSSIALAQETIYLSLIL
jgi:hypothetical protein